MKGNIVELIGRINFTFGSNTFNATLGRNGFWTCTDPDSQRYLNSCHNPHADYGPAVGHFGYAKLAEAAQALRGTYEAEPLPAGGVAVAAVAQGMRGAKADGRS
jgi:hypothetical protein